MKKIHRNSSRQFQIHASIFLFFFFFLFLIASNNIVSGLKKKKAAAVGELATKKEKKEKKSLFHFSPKTRRIASNYWSEQKTN